MTITVASRFANSIGPTRGLLALPRPKALSQSAFTLVAHPSRRDVFAYKLYKAGGLIFAALKAPGRATPAAAPQRTPPAPAGERGSGAGGRPNRRIPHRCRFPGSAAPRIASPPPGDHHFLPGCHRIEEGGEPRLGLRQIDAAHDQITI